ncbi:hypothetical protein [Carnobacterium pleistocenium]|nr:hypothetical protein [Carnobacterium pleistocenium]
MNGQLDTNRPEKIQKTFGTRTPELREALTWLENQHVTDIFMESTG